MSLPGSPMEEGTPPGTPMEEGTTPPPGAGAEGPDSSFELSPDGDTPVATPHESGKQLPTIHSGKQLPSSELLSGLVEVGEMPEAGGGKPLAGSETPTVRRRLEIQSVQEEEYTPVELGSPPKFDIDGGKREGEGDEGHSSKRPRKFSNPYGFLFPGIVFI